MRKKITEEFICLAKEVHGEKYLYDKTVYTTSRRKVIIQCKKHGYFSQRADGHLRGHGCRKCQYPIKRKKTTEEFICEAKEVHGDKYSYDKTVYTTSRGMVIIQCRTHSYFEQEAQSHLRGHGCRKCQYPIKRKKTTEEFICEAKEVHGDKYSYDKTVYTGAMDEVIINCRTHGYFSQQSQMHLSGHGCPKCGGENTREGLLERIYQLMIIEFDHKEIDSKQCVRRV